MLPSPSLGPVGVLAIVLTAWRASPSHPQAVVPVSSAADSCCLLLDEILELKELVRSGRSGRALEREISFAAVGCLVGFVGGIFLSVKAGLGARGAVASATVNHTAVRFPSKFEPVVEGDFAGLTDGSTRLAARPTLSSSPRSTSSSTETVERRRERKPGRIIY